jgi:hypothetical protein
MNAKSVIAGIRSHLSMPKPKRYVGGLHDLPLNVHREVQEGAIHGANPATLRVRQRRLTAMIRTMTQARKYAVPFIRYESVT